MDLKSRCPSCGTSLCISNLTVYTDWVPAYGYFPQDRKINYVKCPNCKAEISISTTACSLKGIGGLGERKRNKQKN